MIVSWNWLKQYVPLDMPLEELERRLMMAGLNHEGTAEVAGDLAIDLEITSNRPDCLGHIGIAREVAVLWGRTLTIPAASPRESETPVGSLVIGGFEPEAKPWVAPDKIPYPFEFQLLDEDWEHFEILMENALLRIPALEHTGLKKLYNGPESFTPDNQFILGEAPECANFFVGAGFNSVGIASAGGAGDSV